MTHTPSPAALATGQRAYAALAQAVDLKWFNAAPRVHGWAGTLTQAYAAVADGQSDALVALPTGTHNPDGTDTDDAQEILDTFNGWLGHDVVWAAFNTVCDLDDDDEGVDIGFATVAPGVALAYQMGW